MWFVYLTWYLNKVVKLDPTVTGLCLLSGQIADGLTTPIVGVSSDKIQTSCGKRQPWFIFGTLFVIPTFMGIFSYPEFINKLDSDGNIENKNL